MPHRRFWPGQLPFPFWRRGDAFLAGRLRPLFPGQRAQRPKSNFSDFSVVSAGQWMSPVTGTRGLHRQCYLSNPILNLNPSHRNNMKEKKQFRREEAAGKAPDPREQLGRKSGPRSGRSPWRVDRTGRKAEP